MPASNWILVSSRWPEIKATAAALHTNGLINIIKDIIPLNNLHFISPHVINEHTDILQQKGINCNQCPPNRNDFDEIIKQTKPTVVIFDRFIMEEQFNWKLPNEIFKILDTQDLHFLRKVRMEYTKKNNEISPIYPDINVNDTSFIREIASMHRCDLVFVVSSFEKEYLINQYGINKDKILVAPFWYEKQENTHPSFDNRSNFMMLGNFLHPPNLDALEWCSKHLWAKIRKSIPNVELHVYGAYPTKYAKLLEKKNIGLYVHGPISTLKPVFDKHRINFAPLRFGAGIKGKITDGWYNNIPCITTHIGAEGLNPLHKFGGLIGNTEQELITNSETLYNNKDIWDESIQFGNDIIGNYFSFSKSGDEFKQLLLQKIEEKDHLRKENHFGAILNYSTNRYTEFFSRYIEMKNKLEEKENNDKE